MSRGKLEGETKIAPYGRGRIACTSFGGQTYLSERPEPLRRALNDLARKLFPQPMVDVKGSNDVDVCVTRNHGKLLVNLINTAGPHRTQSILDTIPPVGPLDITIRLNRKPALVMLEPGARPLTCDYRDGQLQLTVPKVEIHEIVAVQTR